MAPLDPEKLRRIAVLTGGGDAPGMNACVRAVVRTALAYDVDVFGVRRAYAGLVAGDMDRLGARDVGGIIHQGGTVLQTARLPEFKELTMQREALRRLNANRIDALIVIGGDGSLSGALALHRLGFPIVGVPASIDNDIWGTNMSIGVDTAINTILDAIDKVRDTASSHQRAFLIETMGRDCGYLALMSGISGGAEVILIPEQSIPLEEVAERVEQAYIRGKTHAIIVNSEGSEHDSRDIADYLNEQRTGFDVRVTILGHVQRGGRPSGFDRLLATRFGNSAVKCLLAGEAGIMVGLSGREIHAVPLEEVVSRERQANLHYYELTRMLAQ
ncbi:MAG: 6-phosphofructokinase [Chloroflexota bacterium]|nr:6-phosphofructokinase [Chloroflexota bacterium]